MREYWDFRGLQDFGSLKSRGWRQRMGNESTNDATPVEVAAVSSPRRAGRMNWPLLIGSLIIGLVVVLALDSDGSVIWQVILPANGVGAPALNLSGDIYAVDEKGLSAYPAMTSSSGATRHRASSLYKARPGTTGSSRSAPPPATRVSRQKGSSGSSTRA